MSISSFAAAKHLGHLSGWSKTNLELQKIIYIAHMIHLGKKGTPLIDKDEMFEAWHFGPVLPDLYHRAKIYGADPVQNIFSRIPLLDGNGTESKILNAVYELTQDFTASRLIAITHWSEGAWAKNYRSKYPNAIINNEDILREYTARVERAKTNSSKSKK